LNSIVIAVLIFVCVLGGALAGLAIRSRLPANHQDESTRDTVKLVMGLIATIAALVLSLLIASAHSSYDRRESEVQELGVHIVQLDQVLAHYGPEAYDIRAQLRRIVEAELSRIWPNDVAATEALLAPPEGGAAKDLYDKIAGLTPKSDAQRSAQDRALQLVTTMRDTRRLLYEQAGGALSWPFFVVLVFWLVALFVGYGLLAPRNATVVTAFFVGALTVAGATLLILEMNRPYSGLMQISSAPIRNALAEIGR
jgi:FtsH-binding integral membrane protein